MGKGLLFVCRLALLCNICYLVIVVGRKYLDVFEKLNPHVNSTIVVLGVVGVFLNIFVNIATLVAIVFKRKSVPLWLAMVNFLFLIFQAIASYFEL